MTTDEMLDLEPIKARLAAAQTAALEDPEFWTDHARDYFGWLRSDGVFIHAHPWLRRFLEHSPTDIAALIAAAERLPALLAAASPPVCDRAASDEGYAAMAARAADDLSD